MTTNTIVIDARALFGEEGAVNPRVLTHAFAHGAHMSSAGDGASPDRLRLFLVGNFLPTAKLMDKELLPPAVKRAAINDASVDGLAEPQILPVRFIVRGGLEAGWHWSQAPREALMTVYTVEYTVSGGGFTAPMTGRAMDVIDAMLRLIGPFDVREQLLHVVLGHDWVLDGPLAVLCANGQLETVLTPEGELVELATES